MDVQPCICDGIREICTQNRWWYHGQQRSLNTEHHLIPTSYLSDAVDHLHLTITTVYPSSDDWFLAYDIVVTTLQIPYRGNPCKHGLVVCCTSLKRTWAAWAAVLSGAGGGVGATEGVILLSWARGLLGAGWLIGEWAAAQQSGFLLNGTPSQIKSGD